MANVRKLVRLATALERQEGADLRAFLDHATHAEQALARSEPHAPVADEELEAVRLMTIHAAKGLEFPVVCVPELGARPNLRTPDLLVEGSGWACGCCELGQSESDTRARLRGAERGAQEAQERRRTASSTSRSRAPGSGCC